MFKNITSLLHHIVFKQKQSVSLFDQTNINNWRVNAVSAQNTPQRMLYVYDRLSEMLKALYK